MLITYEAFIEKKPTSTNQIGKFIVYLIKFGINNKIQFVDIKSLLKLVLYAIKDPQAESEEEIKYLLKSTQTYAFKMGLCDCYKFKLLGSLIRL